MSSIQVRPATLRDAKAIAEIHVAAAQDAYKELLPVSVLDSWSVQKRQAFWREAIDLCEPQVLVAHIDNEMMGFVGFAAVLFAGTAGPFNPSSGNSMQLNIIAERLLGLPRDP